MLIGLTGGIASGKSKVSARLRDLGAQIVCADQISREVVQPGQAGNLALQESFGQAYFNEKGELDRSKLSKLVFSQPDALQRLNAVLHPLIIPESLRQAREIEAEVGLCVLDVPLLIEVGMHHNMDEVWLVVCDYDLRIRRIMQRDGLSKSEAAARIHSQLSDDQRRACADYIIDNSGDFEQTKIQIDALWKRALGKVSYEQTK
ncbi:MAG: dephospho-CoA kinase [Christensenellales bacterium]|jgi:dephospho-CoA kinase